MSLSDQEKRERRTATQRARRQRQREQARRWAEEMEPRPEHIRRFEALVEPNITAEICREMRAQLHTWEQAPRHLQDRTSEEGGFDDAAVAKLARAGGKARGEDLSYLVDSPPHLKPCYNHLRGKRGAAKIIASLEAEAGNPFSERHVLRLMSVNKK